MARRDRAKRNLVALIAIPQETSPLTGSLWTTRRHAACVLGVCHDPWSRTEILTVIRDFGLDARFFPSAVPPAVKCSWLGTTYGCVPSRWCRRTCSVLHAEPLS